MSIRILVSLLALVTVCAIAHAQDSGDSSSIKTSQGDLKITVLGHGTLMFSHNGKIIHVDPWSKQADYSKLPKADLILVTHEHQDHLDMDAISKITKPETKMVTNQKCAEKLPNATVIRNGDLATVAGLEIEAVPAYNLVHKRDNGQPFHPKGSGNGYIITFGDKRVYVAGDTENTPEMKALKNIDVAFLPMNLPYTMTPEMVADAARSFKPKQLYPYHTGPNEVKKLTDLMKDTRDVTIVYMK